MRLPRLLLLVVSVACSPSGHADVLLGRVPGTTTTPTDIVANFADDATGNLAPQALLGGATTGLQSANAMTYDADQRTLLVADFYGQRIRVFPASSRGDAAATRSFYNAALGQPRQVVAIPSANEYAVISANFISYFPRSANGDTPSLRSSTYLPGLVDNLSGLIYLSGTDEIAVGDYYDAGGGSFGGEVLFFDRNASGAITPTRRIAGPATRLGTYVAALALDPVRGEIFVLAGNADGSNSIQVFAQNGNGNVAPLRSIEGAATLLQNAGGLSYYALRDELLVASGSYNAIPHVLGFPRTASGNVAPSRDISGANTGTSFGNGWTSVVGLPLVEVFKDGFE